MIVDVSEIKSLRSCARKWQLSSRNQMHLTAKVPPKAFALGTAFHESLHKLYLGKSLDQVHQYIANCDVSNDDKLLLTSMVNGYEREILPTDLSEFDVLDIEHHFEFNIVQFLEEYFDISYEDLCEAIGEDAAARLLEINLAGSIDMVALHIPTNTIWGFEHKTAKAFRQEVYSWMDEQPRVYYAALMQYVEEFNKKQQEEIDRLGFPEADCVVAAELGGVYINEVRKLIRAFECKRTTLKYSMDDLRNFMLSFACSMAECHRKVSGDNCYMIPTPDYMKCMNCMYKEVCKEMQYQDITLESVLAKFGDDFKVRENDHLEDKEEVSNQ